MAPPGEVMGYANKLAHHYSPNTSPKYWSNKGKTSKLQQRPLSRLSLLVLMHRKCILIN